MKNIYYKVAKSEKTGRKYACIYVDLGWRKAYLTFERDTICDILDVKPSELLEVECDTLIGTLDI